MNKRLNLSKVTHPDRKMSYDEWVNHFKFGRLYVEPPRLFQGNHFNTEVYTRRNRIRIFSGIIKFLNKIS